jgi:DNA-directed RNA polymerase subunit RPC12/RpoP
MAMILDYSSWFSHKYLCSECGKTLDNETVEKCAHCGALFAKKKNKELNKKTETYSCSICDSILDHPYYNSCPHCGTVFDGDICAVMVKKERPLSVFESNIRELEAEWRKKYEGKVDLTFISVHVGLTGKGKDKTIYTGVTTFEPDWIEVEGKRTTYKHPTAEQEKQIEKCVSEMRAKIDHYMKSRQGKIDSAEFKKNEQPSLKKGQIEKIFGLYKNGFKDNKIYKNPDNDKKKEEALNKPCCFGSLRFFVEKERYLEVEDFFTSFLDNNPSYGDFLDSVSNIAWFIDEKGKDLQVPVHRQQERRYNETDYFGKKAKGPKAYVLLEFLWCFYDLENFFNAEEEYACLVHQLKNKLAKNQKRNVPSTFKSFTYYGSSIKQISDVIVELIPIQLWFVQEKNKKRFENAEELRDWLLNEFNYSKSLKEYEIAIVLKTGELNEQGGLIEGSLEEQTIFTKQPKNRKHCHLNQKQKTKCCGQNPR